MIPFVTGVGEVTRAVKTTVKVVDKADDVVDAANTIYKLADASSDIKKATGSYEILYTSGKIMSVKVGLEDLLTLLCEMQINIEMRYLLSCGNLHQTEGLHL